MKISIFSRYVLVTLFFFLILIPIIVQGDLYFVGGDDTRLYYIFPREYLDNLVFNIISDNTLGGANTGYHPVTHLAPFLYVILFFKTIFPFLNTQHLMYGLNYAFGFIFFYLFLSIWIKTQNFYTFFLKLTVSFFYVFSPFLIGTLYRNHLMIMSMISLLPAMFYFFVKAVLEKKYIYSILVALIYSVFSTTLNALPWSLPILITGFPFFLYVFWYRKKSLLVNLTVFLIAFLFLNSHWIFHYVNSNVNNTGIASSMSYYSSDEFKEANTVGMMHLTRLLSPLVTILTKFDYSFIQNFSIIYIKNIVFISVIIFAGIFASKFKDKKVVNIYWVSLGGLLLSWFLFSPNLGNWGPEYFMRFATTLPFGTMFRNMFDKFSLPLAFYFSFSLGISLFIMEKVFTNKFFLKFIYLLLFIIVMTISLPFLTKRHSTLEGNVGKITGEFNQDFVDLAAYLQDLDNASRVLWFPLTAPNFVSVEDKYYKGHFYSGLSPLRIFSGRGDYVGRFSFLIQSDLYYGDKLIKLLIDGKYEEFALNMQKMNARYIVVDKQILPEPMKSYLYDMDRKYLNFQNDEYKNIILGEKIKDFGYRYSLYLINEKYLSDRIYLTEDYNDIPSYSENIEYTKFSSYMYRIRVKNLETSKKLVFMDPYYKDWVLFLDKNDTKKVYKKGENVIVHGWANGWEIDSDLIIKDYGEKYLQLNEDGTMDLEFILYFEPERYNNLLYKINIMSYVVFMIMVIPYFTYVSINKLKHDR